MVPPAADILAAFGDWRIAFLVSGGAVALVGFGGAMLLPAAPAPRAWDNGVAPLPMRGFALAWLGTLLVSVPAMLPHAALVSSAWDIGLPRADALGLLGVGTIIGRFLLAAIADVLPRRRVFLGCCAAMAASMAVWAAGDSLWALRGFALAFGAAQGGFVAVLPVFIADRFGTARLGCAMGVLYISRGVALLAAPPTLMLTAEAVGLAPPILAFGGLGLLGAVALVLVGNRQRVDGAAVFHPFPRARDSGGCFYGCWQGAASTRRSDSRFQERLTDD